MLVDEKSHSGVCDREHTHVDFPPEAAKEGHRARSKTWLHGKRWRASTPRR